MRANNGVIFRPDEARGNHFILKFVGGLYNEPL